MHKLRFGLFFTLCGWVSTATAQTADIEVRASFEQPAPAFSLSVLNDLDYGVVTIPNGETVGSQCRYTVQPSLGSGSNEAFEILSDGTRIQGEMGRSGCAFNAPGDLARILIGCSTGEAIEVSFVFNSAGVPGVNFTPSFAYPVGAAGGGRQDIASPSSLECPIESRREVTIQGSLFLNDTVLPAVDQIVGTVVLEVSYP